VTWCPPATNRGSKAEPIKPFEPVTTMRCGTLGYSCNRPQSCDIRSRCRSAIRTLAGFAMLPDSITRASVPGPETSEPDASSVIGSNSNCWASVDPRGGSRRIFCDCIKRSRPPGLARYASTSRIGTGMTREMICDLVIPTFKPPHGATLPHDGCCCTHTSDCCRA